MKLWIKTFKNEKIQLNELATNSCAISINSVLDVLTEIKDKFELPLPLVTESNIKSLLNFNHTKFKQADFLEPIEFDYMEISNIPK